MYAARTRNGFTPVVRKAVQYRELLDAMRRLTTLTERLLQRGAHGPLLSAEEAQDAQRELETTRTVVEQLEAMLLLRRQQLRQI